MSRVVEKVCTKCNTAKELAEFPFRDEKRGRRHSYCLECGRRWVKLHYGRNVAYYVQKAAKRRKQAANDINDKLFEYLQSHPCVACGESDPVVLEFDHVRGEKKYNVTEMGWRILSWKTLLKEIAKCEVRCANCHRRKTAQRRNSYRYRKSYGPLAQFG